MAESILVLTHVDETGPAPTTASLEAVTAGMELAAGIGASIAIGIVAVDPSDAARSIAAAGARVLAVSGQAFAQARYASDAAACEALCKAAQASIVLGAGEFAFCPGCRGRCTSSRRGRGHAHHVGTLRRNDRSFSLAVSAAD